jgi:hypothetical protein
VTGEQINYRICLSKYHAPVTTKVYDIGIDTSRDLDIYTNIYARERVEAATRKCSAALEYQES